MVSIPSSVIMHPRCRINYHISSSQHATGILSGAKVPQRPQLWSPEGLPAPPHPLASLPERKGFVCSRNRKCALVRVWG